MDRLRGKRALITGGSSGIGLETAKQFIAEGARVAVTACAANSFEEARQELGDRAIYIVSDAASAEGQRKLAGEIKSQFGNLDVLFINAGIADLKPVEHWDESKI